MGPLNKTKNIFLSNTSNRINIKNFFKKNIIFRVEFKLKAPTNYDEAKSNLND